MSPDSLTPQAIPVTFTGPLSLEDPHRVEEAIRRGIRQAVREFQRAQQGSQIAAAAASDRELRVLGDTLRIGPTPISPVFGLSRVLPQWVRAGGYLEVETDNPVRAANWGRQLFGERGFVVLAKPHEPGRLLVRALATPLHANDFGGFVPAVSREPGHVASQATAPASGATFVTDPENRPVIISTAEGIRLYRTYAAGSPTAWAGENIDRWLADPANPGALDESEASKALARLTLDHRDDLSIAHLLVTLDHSLFAAMSVEDRRRYLLALMHIAESIGSGVDTEQLGAAMVELVASCRQKSELDALLAPLAASGALLKLFSQFDKPTFQLLVAVGSHLSVTALEPVQLLDIVVYQLKHPMSMIDIVEFVGTAYDWLRSTVTSLGDLPLLPVELGSGVSKLFELYMLVSRALGEMPIPIPGFPSVPLPPDPAAQAQLRALLASAGTTGRMAMLGLNHIEQLAGAGSGAVASALVRRVMRVVMLEILAAFVTGLPEAKAAAIAEKIAAQARLFEALATAMKLADAGEVGRLMWLLPTSYAEDVVRLLKKAPARSISLKQFLAASSEAKESGRRLMNALRFAKLVEDGVGRATELAQDVVAGAKRLLDLVGIAPSWSGDAVRALLRDMPVGDMPALLRIAGRLTPAQLVELGPSALRRVAGAPRALGFVIDAGAHALAPTARAFGTNPARYENFLGRVAEAKKTLGTQQYHDLLERLAAGDIADFDDADWLSRAAEAAKKSLRATSHDTIPASSLGKIGTITTKDGFRREVTRILRENPGHPLRFLLDEHENLHPSTGDFMHWFENPQIIEAGHLTSAKSLAEAGGDQLVVMSTFENRLASGTIEHPSKGGHMSIGVALEIGGVPIDPQTAAAWVSKGLLDPGALARGRRVWYRLASEEAVGGSVIEAAAQGIRVELKPPRVRVSTETSAEVHGVVDDAAEELAEELEQPVLNQMIMKEPDQ